MILTSVLSLRSFNQEFTRFEKKHDLWSDLTNKNTLTPQKGEELLCYFPITGQDGCDKMMRFAV